MTQPNSTIDEATQIRRVLDLCYRRIAEYKFNKDVPSLTDGARAQALEDLVNEIKQFQLTDPVPELTTFNRIYDLCQTHIDAYSRNRATDEANAVKRILKQARKMAGTTAVKPHIIRGILALPEARILLDLLIEAQTRIPTSETDWHVKVDLAIKSVSI